jgi:hypothetical protein
MEDHKQTELAAAKTREMPAAPAVAPPDQKDDRKFRAEQERILKMIAADAPLSKILSNLVLMIEAQSPEMICSILLLSDDGNHVKHAVAPSLPENYVKVIDGEPIGPKHGSCGTAMFRGKPVIVSDISTDPLWDEYRNFAWAIGGLLVHPDNVEQRQSAWFVCHVLPRAPRAKRRRKAPHRGGHQTCRPGDSALRVNLLT